jgi:small conductance mechanosensitive channel
MYCVPLPSQSPHDASGSAAGATDALNVKGEGRGFQVFLIDLGDSSVNWVVRFWTTGADFWAAKEQLTRAVKQHLDEAGIGIPFPQMDVHMPEKD